MKKLIQKVKELFKRKSVYSFQFNDIVDIMYKNDIRLFVTEVIIPLMNKFDRINLECDGSYTSAFNVRGVANHLLTLHVNKGLDASALLGRLSCSGSGMMNKLGAYEEYNPDSIFKKWIKQSENDYKRAMKAVKTRKELERFGISCVRVKSEQ